MDISLFFEPIDHAKEHFAEKTFGALVQAHTKESIPDPRDADIALIGVRSDPGRDHDPLKKAPDAVREELYELFMKDITVSIVDLGNMNGGHTEQDTLFALSTVLAELIQNDTIPIVIGGGKGLAFANYLAYEKLERTVNITSIEGSMEVGAPEDELKPSSYLTKIVMHRPNYLFNFANIGYQSYQTDTVMVDLMNKLFFDAIRLGEVRNETSKAEPIIRDSDLVLINISAVKGGDAPGSVDPSPNGFGPEDICEICMYAGLSDKVSSFSIYEFDPDRDIENRTSKLLAQMIWCFVDGFLGRVRDIPYVNKKQFVQYHVAIGDGKQDLLFLKSKKSDRWWVQVPYSRNENSGPQRQHYAPCSYADYNMALKDEVPDTWWKTYQKLV